MKKSLFFALVIAIVLSACSSASTQANTVQSRPQFAGQLNLKDIVPGTYVYEVGMGYTYETLILSGPYKLDGECRFDSVWIIDNKPQQFIQQNYCADEGLVKYDTKPLHGWNPYNHLIKDFMPALTKAQLDAVKSTLVPEPGYETPVPVSVSTGIGPRCSFNLDCPAALPYCNITYVPSGSNYGICSATKIFTTQVIGEQQCPTGYKRQLIYPQEGSEVVCLPK